jgi:hypothetical protein
MQARHLHSVLQDEASHRIIGRPGPHGGQAPDRARPQGRIATACWATANIVGNSEGARPSLGCSVSNGCSIGALIEEVRFAADSPLEGAVYCELVSESGFSA